MKKITLLSLFLLFSASAQAATITVQNLDGGVFVTADNDLPTVGFFGTVSGAFNIVDFDLNVIGGGTSANAFTFAFSQGSNSFMDVDLIGAGVTDLGAGLFQILLNDGLNTGFQFVVNGLAPTQTAVIAATIAPVPLPAAAYLFLSAIAGLALIARRRRQMPSPVAA